MLHMCVFCALKTYGEPCVCVGRGNVTTSTTINQHSPGGVAMRVKRMESLYQLRKE